jgi:hypothetical protein
MPSKRNISQGMGCSRAPAVASTPGSQHSHEKPKVTIKYSHGNQLVAATLFIAVFTYAPFLRAHLPGKHVTDGRSGRLYARDRHLLDCRITAPWMICHPPGRGFRWVKCADVKPPLSCLAPYPMRSFAMQGLDCRQSSGVFLLVVPNHDNSNLKAICSDFHVYFTPKITIWERCPDILGPRVNHKYLMPIGERSKES